MYIILWEYQVKLEKQAEFEKIYAANGAWAELFKKGTGYLGTELLYKADQPPCFLTIDRWASKQAYETFLTRWAGEYKFLDTQCEGLTEQESLLGTWSSTA